MFITARQHWPGTAVPAAATVWVIGRSGTETAAAVALAVVATIHVSREDSQAKPPMTPRTLATRSTASRARAPLERVHPQRLLILSICPVGPAALLSDYPTLVAVKSPGPTRSITAITSPARPRSYRYRYFGSACQLRLPLSLFFLLILLLPLLEFWLIENDLLLVPHAAKPGPLWPLEFQGRL